MKRVLTAAVLIPLVILALFKAPLWLFTLLVFAVAVLAAREYLGIATATGFRPFNWLSYLFLSCIFVLLTLSFLTNWRVLQGARRSNLIGVSFVSFRSFFPLPSSLQVCDEIRFPKHCRTQLCPICFCLMWV